MIENELVDGLVVFDGNKLIKADEHPLTTYKEKQKKMCLKKRTF